MQTVSRRTGEPAKRYKNAMRLLSANETAFREGWYQKGFFTAEFWYRLVQNAQKGTAQNEPLWKRPNWFTDHFFDGHNSIFAIHCLIEYTEMHNATRN
jgi:hypothetical protein